MSNITVVLCHCKFEIKSEIEMTVNSIRFPDVRFYRRQVNAWFLVTGLIKRGLPWVTVQLDHLSHRKYSNLLHEALLLAGFVPWLQAGSCNLNIYLHIHEFKVHDHSSQQTELRRYSSSKGNCLIIVNGLLSFKPGWMDNKILISDKTRYEINKHLIRPNLMKFNFLWL